MARVCALQLSQISLTFGGEPIFDGLNLIVQPGERIALVGRNGSGKSTLMKIMAGLVEPDQGEVTISPGVTTGYMEQDPDLSSYATLGDFAAAGLDPAEQYKIERAGAGLKLDPDRPTSTASGGERRRAALARLMAQEPRLMLLDEPTNHLDIEAIAWLEDELRTSRASIILISHDRAFLNALSRATLWVDRGEARRLDKGFAHFEPWRDKVWQDEDLARHKLNRKIKAEARWAVEGISARRKRNQGRVRALGDLREQRAAQITRQGTAAMALESGPQSGRKVIEATGISKSFGDNPIINPFDLKIMRGDRIAFVGPNGVGKTTLLNMLIGNEPPDTGNVTLGSGLEIALFDQSRAQLDPDMTLWDSLTSDPQMRVGGKTDQIMVRGAPRHVIGYLKDFLFDERQARAPVHSLSGGEKARLLLCKVMARTSNLLVLDEPTNDLDVETLDLLEDLLGQYAGTVLLVSHDRDFLDRVAVTTIAMEGGGRAEIYAGGWSDYQAQRNEQAPAPGPAKPARTIARSRSKTTPNIEKHAPRAPAKSKLSFTQHHRLNALPGEIDKLASQIAQLQQLMADPDLYTRAPDTFHKASAALTARQQQLAQAEETWLELAELAEDA